LKFDNGVQGSIEVQRDAVFQVVGGDCRHNCSF